MKPTNILLVEDMGISYFQELCGFMVGDSLVLRLNTVEISMKLLMHILLKEMGTCFYRHGTDVALLEDFMDIDKPRTQWQSVNAFFIEGDRNIHGTDVAPQEDFMDTDEPSQVATNRPPSSLLPSTRDMNPFSLPDPNLNTPIIDSGPGFTCTDPDHPESAARIEKVAERLPERVPETRGSRGTMSIHDEDNADFPSLQSSNPRRLSEQDEGVLVGASLDACFGPSALTVSNLPDYGIEEEMIRAAIEASKRDAELGRLDDPVPQQSQSQLGDPELAHVNLRFLADVSSPS